MIGKISCAQILREKITASGLTDARARPQSQTDLSLILTFFKMNKRNPSKAIMFIISTTRFMLIGSLVKSAIKAKAPTLIPGFTIPPPLCIPTVGNCPVFTAS